jgi:hypothetical protein
LNKFGKASSVNLYVALITGLQEACVCLLGGYVDFPKLACFTVYQITRIEREAKYINILKGVIPSIRK